MIVFVVTWNTKDNPPHMRVFDLEENALLFAQKLYKRYKDVYITRCHVRSAAWD